jgi:hypothetical protein
MPPPVPTTDGIVAGHSLNIHRPWDAQPALDGFESAVVPQPPSEQTQIHVSLIERQIRILTQQHGEIERRAVKGHEQIIVPQRVTKPAWVQGFAPDK